MEKAIILVAALFVAVLVAGTVAVEYDKDMLACKAEFASEVNEIEGREFAMQLMAGGNDIYAEEIKDAGPDFPYNGNLDVIISTRDQILKDKGVLMIGNWWTGIRGGMRETSTLSIYIPYKPWKLRY